MLSILRRISQEVGTASSLEEATRIIVRRVREALGVDVCSVYLKTDDEAGNLLWLRATEGLNAAAVGRVSLAVGEGLVGLVAERAEPVNTENASGHPHYRYFPETGEERYDSFLGVPIIHQRRLLGVLVVQQKDSRSFSDDAVAFVFTVAAQLAGLILHTMVGEGVMPKLGVSGGARPVHTHAQGLAGAPGIGMGRAVVAFSPAALEAVPDRAVDDVDAEIERLARAVKQVKQDLVVLRDDMHRLLPPEESALFDAYIMMLDGDALWHDTVGRIRAGNWAPGAWRATIAQHTSVFEDMEDAYLRERASDIRDLGRRVLMALRFEEAASPTCYEEGTILVGDELSPTQLAEIPPGVLAGIVSLHGSSASHIAILARTLGVPTVMGAADLPIARLEGKELIIDGYNGRVFVEPAGPLREEFQRLALEEQELSRGLDDLIDEPAETPDGTRIALYSNAGLQAEISPRLLSIAEGVGLYRTEIPFQIRDRFPGEDEQRDIYRTALAAFAPRPVVLRTLDIGGDKQLPYFPIVEENPFLGWRGIRITLDHPEIFLNQVRGMLKANVGLGNLKILLPLVSNLAEFREAKNLIRRAFDELLEVGIAVVMPEIGVMIEVPAAVFQVEAYAREADFISVGSNDLTQYLLAVDRNNERVGEIYDILHPSVLQAIVMVAEGAHRHARPVSVCGELAGNPMGALLLLGMGIDSLSMSAASLLRVKWVVRSFRRARAHALLEQSLQLEDGGAVRRLLVAELEQAGLGGLVRAGK